MNDLQMIQFLKHNDTTKIKEAILQENNPPFNIAFIVFILILLLTLL